LNNTHLFTITLACLASASLLKMEREEYQKQINDLLQAVETLLKSNKVMGERVAHLERVADAYEDLKKKYAKLEGELAMRKRGQYGKKNEKSTETSETTSASDGSKDDDEKAGEEI